MTLLVGQRRLDANGAGGLVDLVVDQRYRAAIELVLAIARERRRGHRPALERGAQLPELLLGQSENDRDGLELRHHHHAGGIGRVDDVARVDQADAGAPVDRRGDGGVLELGTGAVDGGRVALDLRGQLRDERALRVDGLLACQVLGREQCIAVHVAPRIGELRQVLGARGDGHVERRLVGPRVDLHQQRALPDVLSLLERDFVDLTVDPRRDGDGVEGLHRPESLEIHRHVRALHARHVHGDGRREFGRRSGPVAEPVPGTEHHEERERGGADEARRHGQRALHAGSCCSCQPPPSAW